MATLLIGVDVGSTTVKCVVVDPTNSEVVWSRYERHETQQAEKAAEMLGDIEAAFPDTSINEFRIFITGSGAGPIAEHIGARFVQEVNAVSIAVEARHPDVRSVVELGGQDAKIILFQDVPESAERRVKASMNDKCASGTGATLDKCSLKVGMTHEELAFLGFDATRLHHVAARCGVFAETDIVNLIKAGVPPGEVMNSLANAIVMQNLTVLTRGYMLHEKVLLLGGPNTFLPFLQECWQLRIAESWEERGHAPPERPIEELVFVPQDSQFYAALGAALFGMQEPQDLGVYRGLEALNAFIAHGRKAQLGQFSGPPLIRAGEDFEAFKRAYRIPAFTPRRLTSGTQIRGYIGFDGGSTTSKAVLLDEDGETLTKEYLISKGNPIQDAKEILARIKSYATDQDASLTVLGFGITGYAADVLDSALKVDANIVETVAHMLSAKHYFGEDLDVICDVGGQDIKVLFLQNGAIKSFRLSSQCSAGNGMLLQAMAEQFGVAIHDYADVAFEAELSPDFNCGCAVFLDTDRVNFQKEGYTRNELFAGLARVLPKNIWQHVVQVPRLSEFGRKFVLQGGTQRNLAAVKAQVDYIIERVSDAEVVVHPHAGEAGAIGAALEAKRLVQRNGQSTFIGLDAAIDLHYSARTDESTRCNFCSNRCPRTFIDTQTPDGDTARYIAGFSCEKGTVQSKEDVIRLNQERKRLKKEFPNLVDYEASLIFRHVYDSEQFREAGRPLEDAEVARTWFGYRPVAKKLARRGFERAPTKTASRRESIRVGIPRVLNVYTFSPFLRAYLEALAIAPQNVVFSDETSEEMWLEGGKFGSNDPCYPAKVALAHIHNLIAHKHRRKPLQYIWHPTITSMPTFVSHHMGSASCPLAAGTPMVARAAYVKETDRFAEAGVTYVADALNFEVPDLLREQLFEVWRSRLGITREENDWACEQGWNAQRLCDDDLARHGLDVLTAAERNDQVVLLFLSRPYHSDTGLNHRILEEFQTLGYPVLSIRSLPKDPIYLKHFFREDLASGRIADVFDIGDVWPENFSCNSAQKVWAAKFAARHPNVAVVDISSFKCGHDAPTYGIIDSILAPSKIPYLALHDLDANKPGGSFNIRIKTFAYALGLYREKIAEKAAKRSELERAVAVKRAELVDKYREQFQTSIAATPERTQLALAAVFDAYLENASLDWEEDRNAA